MRSSYGMCVITQTYTRANQPRCACDCNIVLHMLFYDNIINGTADISESCRLSRSNINNSATACDSGTRYTRVYVSNMVPS